MRRLILLLLASYACCAQTTTSTQTQSGLGAGGSVTSIIAGNCLNGGTITATGTVSLNLSGSTNATLEDNGVGCFAEIGSPIVNGLYTYIKNVTGSAAVAGAWALPGVPVDATNPATLPYSDRGSFLDWTSGLALALPAVSGQFASNFAFSIRNTAGTLVITPNAAAVDLCNGAATCSLFNNTFSFVYQDSTSAPGHWKTVSMPIANSSGAVPAVAFLSASFQGALNSTPVVVASGTTTTSANGAGPTLTVQGEDNSNAGASTGGGPVVVRGGNLTGTPTNLPGADATIAGGLGTGNSTPSHVKVQSPAMSATSGTAAQTMVTNFTTHKKLGSTTSATATNLFNVAVAANQTVGAVITVHVETTQATPHNCSTTQVFYAAVQNTASTITQQTTAGSIATICDTGTLTLTAAFSAATPSVFSVTPTWATIVPTAVIITVQIQNVSQQDVTLL